MDSSTHEMCECGLIFHKRGIDRHRKTHQRGLLAMNGRAEGYFWAERVQDEDLRGNYFKKHPLRLRDPTLIYNRIFSLFVQQIRIPRPFAHFGRKVVWHIWNEHQVYPQLIEEPSNEVTWELWQAYKRLMMQEEETPGAFLARQQHERFKNVRT